jgi:hypothetical protein
METNERQIMNILYRATKSEWEIVRRKAKNDCATDSVLLEVADRVTALEEDDHKQRLVALHHEQRIAALEAAATTQPAPAADHFRGVTEMVATDEELIETFYVGARGASAIPGFRAVYDHGRQHSAQPRQKEEMVPVLWVRRKPGLGCNASVLAWIPSVEDLPIGEYILYAFPGAAQPRQEEPPAPSPTYELTDVAPLLWVLFNHLGAGSPVGQPIRRYLGMGQHDRMTDKQMDAATRWARESMSVQDCLDGIPVHGSATVEPTPPPSPAGDPVAVPSGLVERVLRRLPSGTDPVFARQAILEIAEWADEEGLFRTRRRLREEADR